MKLNVYKRKKLGGKFDNYDCERGKRPYWLEIEELVHDWDLPPHVLITIWTPISCNTGAIGLSFNQDNHLASLTMPHSIKWEPGQNKHFSTSYVALGIHKDATDYTIMQKTFNMDYTEVIEFRAKAEDLIQELTIKEKKVESCI